LTVAKARAKVPDIFDKLEQVQRRRLVAALCRQARHSRAWFYKALRGETSVLKDLALINEVLALDDNPIVGLRQAAGVDKVALAAALGISRQALDEWEQKPTADRIARVKAALRTA
jgi:DNA-binding transcriptional regulator YiaG